MKLERITDPLVLPITKELVLEDLGLIDGDISDALLDVYMGAATDDVETDTDRGLISQTWRMTLDRFPRGYYTNSVKHYDYNTIFLPKGDLITIDKFEYLDEDEVIVALVDGTDYTVVSNGTEARLLPVEDWASTFTGRDDVVTIDFTVGLGVDDTEMPSWVTAALLLSVRAQYDGCPKSDAYDNKVRTRKIFFDYEKNDR